MSRKPLTERQRAVRRRQRAEKALERAVENEKNAVRREVPHGFRVEQSFHGFKAEAVSNSALIRLTSSETGDKWFAQASIRFVGRTDRFEEEKIGPCVTSTKGAIPALRRLAGVFRSPETYSEEYVAALLAEVGFEVEP